MPCQWQYWIDLGIIMAWWFQIIPIKVFFFFKLANSIAFYYLIVRLGDWTFKVNSSKCRLLAFPENIRLGGKCLAYNIAPKGTICGLYNKHVLVVIDNSSVISKWSFKLIDDPRVIIYDGNMFIIRAIEGILYWNLNNKKCIFKYDPTTLSDEFFRKWKFESFEGSSPGSEITNFDYSNIFALKRFFFISHHSWERALKLFTAVL